MFKPDKLISGVGEVPSQSEVSAILEYNQEDGRLIWKVAANSRAAKGSMAGHKRKDGYMMVSFGGKKYLAHRVIWLLVHGYWPKYIDHMDGDPGNNRMQNLRECSHSENMRNRKLPKNNTSGVKGVTWHKVYQKWQAQVGVDGDNVAVGRYDTVDEAAAAVKAAREKFHGMFSRY